MTTSKLELQISARGTNFKWCARRINGKPQRYKNYAASDESALIKDLMTKIPKYKQDGVQYRVVKLTEEVEQYGVQYRVVKLTEEVVHHG